MSYLFYCKKRVDKCVLVCYNKNSVVYFLKGEIEMKIESIGNWGRYPLFSAKVGTTSSNSVVIYQIRDFKVGQRIKFSTMDELRGRSTSCSPRWNGGIIDSIRGDMLFISRM